MTVRSIIQKSALLLLLIPFLSAKADVTFPGTNDEFQHDDDIVDVAVSAGSFNTLVAAVQAAGLVETLKGDGPFTVFAPSDDAFDLLGENVIQNLLEPENRDQLISILTYHVVSGKIESKDLLSSGSAKTVNGKALPIGLSIGNANIVATDIEASNGIIHVIDRVLIPAESPRRTKSKQRLSKAETNALDLINLAIDRGVPLYNNGQEEACAAIYQVAAEALIKLDADINSDSRRALRKALRDSKNTHDQSDRAWILRRSLDIVYDELNGREMMMKRKSKKH